VTECCTESGDVRAECPRINSEFNVKIVSHFIFLFGVAALGEEEICQRDHMRHVDSALEQ
jgi:hypothetical protein